MELSETSIGVSTCRWRPSIGEVIASGYGVIRVLSIGVRAPRTAATCSAAAAVVGLVENSAMKAVAFGKAEFCQLVYSPGKPSRSTNFMPTRFA